MAFSPILSGTGFAGWAFLQRTKALQIQAFNKAPQQVRDEAYFRAKIGKIDTADLAILMGNFGQTAVNARGDLNNDGRVDDLDVRLFSAQYKLP